MGQCWRRRRVQARIALLEGERRSFENIKVDLMRRIKMLEYALRIERYVLNCPSLYPSTDIFAVLSTPSYASCRVHVSLRLIEPFSPYLPCSSCLHRCRYFCPKTFISVSRPRPQLKTTLPALPSPETRVSTERYEHRCKRTIPKGRGAKP